MMTPEEQLEGVPSDLPAEAVSAPEKKKACTKPKRKANQKKSGGRVRKRGPLFNGGYLIAYAAIVGLLASAQSIWHVWWVKIVTVPLGLIMTGLWIYGQVRNKFSQLKSIGGASLLVVCGAALAVELYLKYPPSSNEDRPQSASRTIAGTRFTYGALTDFYPFGWIVYALNEATTTYEPVVHDKIVWDTSWKKVRIEPDFANDVATIWLPNDIQFNPVGIEIKNATIVAKIRMIPGAEFLFGGIVLGPNQPRLMALVLSNDQRKPVFALGFRILKEQSK